MTRLLPALLIAALAACTPSRPVPPQTMIVTARGETVPVSTGNADAADDPAIWRNAADPAASLIVGTDKKAGLYVYGLDGAVRDFLDAGRVNNVDLAEFGGRIIVAASDRNDEANARVALFSLDTATAKLTALGTVAAGQGEAYGFCFHQQDGALHGFIVLKDGTINQLAFDFAGAVPAARIVRTLKVGTQAEGCIVDPARQRLYVAEEDVGIWRFDALAASPVTSTAVARIDGKRLVADVEGMAIADGYLIASSQGDSAYAVYRLSDDRYIGRFRIGAGRFGATQETDGIEVIAGDFGPDYPAGLMVAQDGDNAPLAQNFKLVSWADVKAALGI
ncbi:phytase [Polymorphobacter sp.]|uniref:phytase n=1 Tax=Polymorphobacter sp. TaxID=1909290 RepID=UPI003F71972E